MARQTISTPRPWTAKVLVTEKSPHRDARESPTKYQKFVIVDEAGGRVQLTLFNTHIGMFKDRLQLNRKYYISNALVKNAPFKYQFGTTVHQWSLHNTCLVEEVFDDENAPAIEGYNFVRSADIVNYKDSPMTIGSQLSASTLYYTRLYDNMMVVNELLNSVDLIANARNFEKEATGAITPMSTIGRMPHLRLFNVRGTIRLISYTEAFVYMSCSSCNGKTSATFNEIYTCNYCGTPTAVSSPRMRAEVYVRDPTGGVTATLTGADAEAFLA